MLGASFCPNQAERTAIGLAATRLGRELDRLADLCTEAAACVAARRAGWIDGRALLAVAARYGSWTAYGLWRYFARCERPAMDRAGITRALGACAPVAVAAGALTSRRSASRGVELLSLAALLEGAARERRARHAGRVSRGSRSRHRSRATPLADPLSLTVRCEADRGGAAAAAFADYGAADGAPAFFFHGWPGSRLDFEANVAAAAAGVRVIAVDRPGIGDPIPSPAAGCSTGPATSPSWRTRSASIASPSSASRSGGPTRAARTPCPSASSEPDSSHAWDR